jgi:hypothetical protein
MNVICTESHEREHHRWTVPVPFTQHFLDDPIRRSQLIADNRFKGSLIVRAAFGANPFPVEPQEWEAITSRAWRRAAWRRQFNRPSPPHIERRLLDELART